MGKTLELLTVLTWKDYLSEFITVKKVQGLRERTIEDYKKHINLFYKNYQGEIDDYHYLCKKVKEYFSTSTIAPATFNIRRAYLKSFFSYLVNVGVLPKNPIDFSIYRKNQRITRLPGL